MPDPGFSVTILVTGANGQLGNEIRILSQKFQGCRFLFTSREDLPIENAERVKIFFDTHPIDYCVNCAAYTAVDRAESEMQKAFLINADAVGSLAKICKEYLVKLIHISTDYVYDGSSQTPLKEDASVGPVNVYGWSKLKGEQLAMQQNPSTLIIRTSWVYSSFGNNFVKTMLRLFKEKTEINVVNDQLGSPTYAADLADVILQFIQQSEDGKTFSGIVNYSNEGVTTWYQFAEEIRALVQSNCQISPVPTSSYVTPAKRPLYSVLDTAKIKALLGIHIPLWKESLKRCIAIIKTA